MSVSKDNIVKIYTDGSSRGNPGPGGCAVILKYNNNTKEISLGYRRTTNNRMELMAAILGLEALKNSNIKCIVYSDSKYVVDSVEKGWLFSWLKKDFKNKKNKDLWLRFYDVYKRFNVTFKWIKGHSNHLENERCDALAVASSKNSKLLIDTEYETIMDGLIK